jgi:FtsH-binding integral membrane protein
MPDPFDPRQQSAVADEFENRHSPFAPVAVGDRSLFITRTYMTLLGAILAFVGIEVALFTSGTADRIANAFIGMNWLIVLGGFILVSWIATRVAHTTVSLPAQFAALAIFVVAEALVFVPLLYVANAYAPGAIRSAAGTTLLGFVGLTFIAFGTRKDFSFLRGILFWAGMCALVAIVASVIFGMTLGTWFSVAMVALAGASILYDTSNIIHHYRDDRYVGAALELFASVAMMFWYLLRLFMSRD